MTTVSTRIDDDLKRKIDELNINTSEVVREALEEEVKQKRRERIKERGKEIEGLLDERGISSDDVVESIRQDRDAELEER